MKYLIIPFLIFTLNACSQEYGEGYSFKLFENIANRKLVDAIKNEDTSAINDVLKNEKAFNINLQEKKYGQTLLSLAVGNDKPASVLALLQNGANPNICDSFGLTSLGSISDIVNDRNKSFEIIRALLKFDANPNLQQCNSLNNQQRKYVPLMGAFINFNCSKLLIDKGADCNFKDSTSYPVWLSILSIDGKISESIFVAEYLICDKKVTIPKIIGYSKPNKNPLFFDKFLLMYDVGNDSKKMAAKKRIMKYLNVNP